GAGQARQAVQDFGLAEALIEPDERWQGVLLRDLVRRGKHAALLANAEPGRKDKHDAEAADALRRAAAAEFPAPLRLRALAREANLEAEAGRAERAITSWQTILSDPALRRGTLRTDDGVPRSAAMVAA